jgi:hypothetical protein
MSEIVIYGIIGLFLGRALMNWHLLTPTNAPTGDLNKPINRGPEILFRPHVGVTDTLLTSGTEKVSTQRYHVRYPDGSRSIYHDEEIHPSQNRYALA